MDVKRPQVHSINSIIFISLLIFVSANYVFAGWTPDVRLTHRRFEMEPQVVARNDTVHVVWQQIAGPQHISYLRSTNGGYIWDPWVNLEEDGHYGAFPDLSLFPGGVFVGWFDEDTSDFTTYVAYSRSPDGGAWDPPEYVSQAIIRMYDVGTAAFGDSIYAVYFSRQFDSTGTHPLRFLYSSDTGATWSEEVTVGHVSEYTNFLHVAHCRNSLYVVWASDLAPLGYYREVMAAISHDGGQTWSDVMQLSSPDTAAAQHTCVACDEVTGHFAVGWMDYGLSRSFPGDLFVRLTTDGGYTWRPVSHATTHHGVSMSSLAVAGDTLWAVWSDRDPAYGLHEEICFTHSTDLGDNWSPYERLTFEPEHSWAPTIAYDNGRLHVVWYNDNPPPDSGMDIYYKRYDPEPDAVRGEVGDMLPEALSLSAYPNPFNSSVMISYSNLNKGGAIAIHDIQGKLIRSFALEGGADGKINWDATDAMGNKVSSGVYFARAEASQNSNTFKLVYLK